MVALTPFWLPETVSVFVVAALPVIVIGEVKVTPPFAAMPVNAVVCTVLSGNLNPPAVL